MAKGRDITSMQKLLARVLPITRTLSEYNGTKARSDVVAGLTTAVVVIPQGMAYALIAGLPPIYGLYAAVVPLLVYGLLGTSRELAIGPAALVSLMVAAAVGRVAPGGTEAFIAYAMLLALIVGLIQFAMGVARLGFLVNFLSHSVIGGFTSAAALIIGFSQLGNILGFSIERSQHVHEIVESAISQIGQTHVPTLALGTIAIALLILLKELAPRAPRILAVAVAGIIAVWALGLDGIGVAVVGNIPQGLPKFSAPPTDWAAAKELLPVALAIALVGFTVSIAVAKRYARPKKYAVDANRELVGLGFANITGAFAGAYPISGSFGRTAVNATAGAQTSVAGMVTAVVVGLSLLFLTPVLYYLPMAVLSAIIIMAVASLIDIDDVRYLWRVKRTDLAMWIVTFIATLTLGIERGIGVGIVASLSLLIFQSTRPHVAVLGRLPGRTAYRNVARFPDAVTTPGVLVLRLDAQIYFGNVNFLKETLDRLEAAEEDPLHAIILDASGINQIDASGEAAFREILENYRARSIRLLLANVKGPVRDVFERSGLRADLAESGFFLSVHDAMQALEIANGPAAATHPSSAPDASEADV